MCGQSSTVEAVVERLASSQHGVVTRIQLLGAGVTVRQIEHRIHSGALLREHRGVYRVGHRAPSVEARYMAAVRAAGNDALLSGRSASYLFGLLRGHAPTPEVICRTQRRIRGVITHRSRRVGAEDRTIRRGIPVTTVARTLVDLASLLSAEELARACHEASVRYRTTPAH